MSIAAEVLAQYEATSKKMLDETLAIINAPEWKESKKEPEITFYTRSNGVSPFLQVKSVVTIPASMDKVLATLKPIDPINNETPKEHKHGILERKTVYGPSEDETETSLLYVCMEPPKFISPRDFVLFRRLYKLDGGKYCYFHTSVESDLLPEVKGRERGTMDFQGYLCEPEGDGVKLTFFVHADPKGSLPAWAYNQVVTNQGYAAKGVRKQAMAK